MPAQERRLQTRTPARHVVTYVSIGKKRFTAAIENISVSGVFLHTTMAAAAGARIGLEFFDGESKKTLILTATVTRVTELGVAVKFDGLSFDQHRRLSSLIGSIEVGRPTEAAAPAPGIKRRRNRRVPTKDATAHLRVKGDVVALSLPVTNVSMGGLFLETTGRLPLGAEIDVELTLGGQAMVISGQVVGEASGGASGQGHGLSIRFGPMPRRTADRLRSALELTAPLAADGLEQEQLPGGYCADPPAPAAPAASVPARRARSPEFDFGVGDLGGEPPELLLPEDLSTELERLRAEVRTRQDRIALLEETLRDPKKT